ncbi:MAG: S24 family peptidase [Candidatus Margulisiibacteriota bacterium]
MKELHPTQEKLLKLLKQNIADPLTIRALQDELSISSPSVVYHHLQQLERKGYLRRNPANPKDYQILADSPDKIITYLNLYGLASCGPNGSVLDGNPIDRIPISTRILGFPSTEAFMMKARGSSMAPKINDGDLIIARRSKKVLTGNIVVCINNSEVMIKKIQKENGNTILVSLNPNNPPFLAADDFRVEGEVRSIISYNMG